MLQGMNHLLSKHQPAMSSISFWYNYTSSPTEELIPGSERSVSILEHLEIQDLIDGWTDLFSCKYSLQEALSYKFNASKSIRFHIYRICTVLSKIQQPEHGADYLEDYNSNCTSNNQKQKEHKASISCQLHIVQGQNTAQSVICTLATHSDCCSIGP